MDFTEYWKGTQAYALLVARKLAKKPIFTTQSEAERRAAVCINCPKHIDAEHSEIQEKGWVEDWAKGKFRKQIQGRSTSQDGTLGKCGVCSCECRTLAHLHKEIVESGGTEGHPENCWKHNAK